MFRFSRFDVYMLPAFQAECFRGSFILPSQRRITLSYCHKVYLHRNFQTVINEELAVYSFKIRSALKKIRRMCQVCKILDSQTSHTTLSSTLCIHRDRFLEEFLKKIFSDNDTNLKGTSRKLNPFNKTS